MAHAIDQIYKRGSDLMCSKECPCNIKDKSIFTNGINDKFSMRNYTISSDGYTTLLECPKSELSKGHQAKYS